MKCTEFRELAAAYALDALREEERLACVHHLSHEGPHDGCEALVSSYERAVDALAEAAPAATVPEHVWRALALRLQPGEAPRAAVSPVKPVTRRMGLRELSAWSAAAAAVVAALWMGQHNRMESAEVARVARTMEQEQAELTSALTESERARQECAATLARVTAAGPLVPLALSLLGDPTTVVTPMKPAGERALRATALYNESDQRAVVISSSLSPIPGKDYELWVVAAGSAPQPAGFVRFDASGLAIGEFDPALLEGARPLALAVSLEPAGGMPTPTEVVLMAKVSG